MMLGKENNQRYKKNKSNFKEKKFLKKNCFSVQSLLDALLWDIYGNITIRSLTNTESGSSESITSKCCKENENSNSWKYSEDMLEKQC